MSLDKVYKAQKLSNVEDIKYAKALHRVINPDPSVARWKRVSNTKWSAALNKHVQNDYDKVTALIDTFTNKMVLRMNNLEILVSNSGQFFDRTAGKAISLNLVKLIMSEEMREEYKRDCDGIDFPLPEKDESLSIVEITLLEYKDYAAKQLKKHFAGEPTDPCIGVSPI